MTGKEALEYIIELVFKHISIGRNSGKSYTNKALYKISEELEKLTKYKRAFEILNRDKELTLHKGKEPILGTDEYKLSFVNWKSLTKEEYELLEELIKGEETQN